MSHIVRNPLYFLNHWAALTRYLDDGRLPLENNAAESTLRPIRLGENKYLSAGSTAAAKRAVTILSMLATARANRLNTTDYLVTAFTEIARRDEEADVSDLLPGAIQGAAAQ